MAQVVKRGIRFCRTNITLFHVDHGTDLVYSGVLWTSYAPNILYISFRLTYLGNYTVLMKNFLHWLIYPDQHLWGTLLPDSSCDVNTHDLQSPLQLYSPGHRFAQFFSETENFPALRFGSGWYSNTFWNVTNNNRFSKSSPSASSDYLKSSQTCLLRTTRQGFSFYLENKAQDSWAPIKSSEITQFW